MMPRYRVLCSVNFEQEYEVEAETLDDAIEKAKELAELDALITLQCEVVESE